MIWILEFTLVMIAISIIKDFKISWIIRKKESLSMFKCDFCKRKFDEYGIAYNALRKESTRYCRYCGRDIEIIKDKQITNISLSKKIEPPGELSEFEEEVKTLRVDKDLIDQEGLIDLIDPQLRKGDTKTIKIASNEITGDLDA
jgi:hypothetical protein